MLLCEINQAEEPLKNRAFEKSGQSAFVLQLAGLGSGTEVEQMEHL